MSKLYVNEIHPKTSGGIITTTGLSNIKEVLTMLCDGGTYTVPSGTYTATNVTAAQSLTTTYGDVNGSVINYTPPSGTTAVVYEFNFGFCRDTNAFAVAHFKFYIAGTEVVYARHALGANSSPELVTTLKYVIPIGGSANTNTGRLASWSGAKELKIQAREYNSSTNDAKLFTTFNWDGGPGQEFSTPTLTITALGG